MVLDQFYTKDEIASKCYRKFIRTMKRNNINMDNYTYIEPSAGKGAFYKLLPLKKRIGIDLDPKYEELIKMDFLKYDPDKKNKYVVIGNPPFGKISSMAIKFFNKSASYADIIAFIVPRTFKRISVQNKLSLNFKLIYNNDLPLKPCCFEPEMMAKCCFQIWIRSGKREKISLPSSHKDFEFLKLGPKDEKTNLHRLRVLILQ